MSRINYRNLAEKIRHYGAMLLGAAILSFGLFNIHSRAEVTEGGVLGMTLLLHHWLGISPGISGFCMDTLCYIGGFRLLGKPFLKNALFSSFSFAAFYSIFEKIGYVLPDLSPYPLVAAVVGGLFVGIGVGLVVREGGASGGDDALAIIIAKLTGRKLAYAYFATDFIVLMLSLSYIPPVNILCSLLSVTISSAVIGQIETLPIKRLFAKKSSPRGQKKSEDCSL